MKSKHKSNEQKFGHVNAANRNSYLNIIHCALASCGAVHCNRCCLWVCDSGRAVSEPYYSQRAVFALSAFFIIKLVTQ